MPASRPVTLPHPNPPAPQPNRQPIPNTENPGPGAGLGAEPKTMDIYATSGKNQVNNFLSVTKAPKGSKPDTQLVATEAELAKHGPNGAFLDIRKSDKYKIEDMTLHFSDLKTLKNFKWSELGFDIKDAGFVSKMVVTNKAPGSPTIIQGTYAKNGQFIVYQDAFKAADTTPGTKVPLNEMGLQNFIAASKDAPGGATNFKAAFLTNIQNKEFWAITRQNYNDKNQPFNQVLIFPRGTPEFDRYMGSPNFNSKFFSFANHHEAIGNKVPDKVIVIPKQAENSGNELTVAVVFKDA